MKEENIYNYCHIAGRTDIGCKRQANEDSMGNFETINGLAAVVCDGMGGHECKIGRASCRERV